MTDKDRRIIICPKCDHMIDPRGKTLIVTTGIPRFKWWVAPINIVGLSLLFVLLNIGSSIDSPDPFPWSIWVVVGLWLLYFVGIALKYRPNEAWLIVPIFFGLLSIFLASIDIFSNDERSTIFLGLSWSFYPIVVIMILFVILPIMTFLGKSTKKPVDILREIVEAEELMIDEQR